MSLDFNHDDRQMFDLIPANSVVPVVMTIRPGGAGEGGWFTQSNSSDAQYLDCEFTVSAGPFARRKFWQAMTLFGGKTDESGNSKAGKITRSTLRAALESARNINPTDESPNANAARRVNGWQDFSGLEFVVKVGIEKGEGGYPDKNKMLVVVTPDKKEYAAIKAGNFGQAAPAASAPAPAWASGPVATAQPQAAPTWAQPGPAQAAGSAAPSPAPVQTPAMPAPAQAAPANSPVPTWAQ